MSRFDPLNIGEAARRLGVSTAALRLYERKGLLPTTTRSSGGYRSFRRTICDASGSSGAHAAWGCRCARSRSCSPYRQMRRGWCRCCGATSSDSNTRVGATPCCDGIYLDGLAGVDLPIMGSPKLRVVPIPRPRHERPCAFPECTQRTAEFAVEGMTCASCVSRVERALRAVPGVSDAASTSRPSALGARVGDAADERRMRRDRAGHGSRRIRAAHVDNGAEPEPSPWDGFARCSPGWRCRCRSMRRCCEPFGRHGCSRAGAVRVGGAGAVPPGRALLPAPAGTR